MKKIVCLCFVFLFSICLVGCENNSANLVNTQVAVNEIVINKTHAYVDVGDTIILTAQVYPFNADNQNIIWRSDNVNIATVDGGIVLGNAEGRTVITCKSEDGEFEDKCIIYVSTPKLNYSKYPNNLTSNNNKNVSFNTQINKELNNQSENEILYNTDNNFTTSENDNNKNITNNDINGDIEKQNNIFDFEKQLDRIFNTQKEFFEDMNNYFENLKTQKINHITTQSGENIEKEDENQNSSYYYEYKYNSNGIDEEKDENTIYQDENTIVKYFTF